MFLIEDDCFPGSTVVQTLPASTGEARGAGSVAGPGRPLEKETATHSSILAWIISMDKGPGGSPEESMGSQRVRHD